MEGTMRAWFVTEIGKMEMREVPIPKIGPRDILFKCPYVGVCGSDLHAFYEGASIQHYPITLGHEFTGYVVEAGSEVKDIPVGMRFMGTNIQWCGKCAACKSGNVMACEDVCRKGLGFGVNGVFAEYSVLYNAMLGVSVYPLPDNINDLEGATCEPMCVGAGGADALGLRDGDKVVIYGAGIVGQGFVQAIKSQWPHCEVAIVNRSKFRLELAKKSGADYVISPTPDKPAIDTLREIWGSSTYPYHYKDTKSTKAHVAVECTGNMDIVGECFKVVDLGGVVSLVAAYPDDVPAPISPADMFFKSIRYVPGLNGNFAKSVQLMSEGKFSTTHLITHVYPFEKLPEAFEMARNTKKSCKVMIKVDPNAPDYPYNKQD